MNTYIPELSGDMNVVFVNGTSKTFPNVVINSYGSANLAVVMDGAFLVFEDTDRRIPTYVPNVSHFSFEPYVQEPLAQWEQELLYGTDEPPF